MQTRGPFTVRASSGLALGRLAGCLDAALESSILAGGSRHQHAQLLLEF